MSLHLPPIDKATKQYRKIVRALYPKAVCLKQEGGAYIIFEYSPVTAATRWLGWGHDRLDAWKRAAQ